MERKIKVAFFILLCSLVSLSLGVFNSRVTADSEIPLALDDLRFKENSTKMSNSTMKIMEEMVIVNQTFDGEDVGAVPEGWNITEPQYGGLIVDNQTYYGGNASARFVDNSSDGSPFPYRIFPSQSGTLVATFAIRPTASSGDHTNLIIYVDDGHFSGSNIYFTEDGTIEYRDDHGSHSLRTYSANTWYEIKMVMSIPSKTYHIYINDHLEARDARFNKFDVCQTICRIVFGGSLVWQPIGYIDELLIIRGIRVPEDCPALQRAIDVANPGDTIFIDSGIYYDHISIKSKNDLRLIGENRSASILDGKFGWAAIPIVSLEHSDNITISRFTIRNGFEDGISVNGSNNNITDNAIISNLGRGVHIEGEEITGNTISGNLIENNAIGIECVAVEGNNFYHNKFVCNNVNAIDYGLNEWDHDYPDGGNYWSDYIGADDNGDGIGDVPYVISSATNSIDRYPLYLIENVTLDTVVRETPFQSRPGPPSYHQKAIITAVITKDVQVDEAMLFFTYNSTWRNETMAISRNRVRAEIPKQPYWTGDNHTVVQYKVNASNVHGVWAVSATYNYMVTDTRPPIIGNVSWTPTRPFENQTVTVTANVTEPPSASGVDKAFLYWKADESSWSESPMSYHVSSQTATVTLLRLPAPTKVTFFIKAFDKAGCGGTEEVNHTYQVRYIPKLSTINCTSEEEVGSLDFGVISQGKSRKGAFCIKNAGKGTLRWNILVEKGDPWISAKPEYGETEKNETIDVTVTTKVRQHGVWVYLEAGDYVFELLITSNGGRKTIYIYVKVRTVRIDDTKVSDLDGRCAVGSNQSICFHVVWDHNGLPVQDGKIYVNKKPYEIGEDDEGWLCIYQNFSDVGERTWEVTRVACEYTHNNKTYVVMSYIVTAPEYPVSLIWDRVQITLNITDDRIDIGKGVNITWTGIYECDGTVFNGSITLNNTLTIPFKGSTTQMYSKTVKRCFTTESISDPAYGLNFTSNIVCCIWDRIRIIGGGASQAQADINQTATVWFVAVYEYVDETKAVYEYLDETKGQLNITIDGTKEQSMTWSRDDFRWEYNYPCNTTGTITFQVSGMLDNQYGITEWTDDAGPVSIACRAPLPPTGWLNLSFTVDGKTPTKSATYRVEYPNGTIKTYSGINVSIPNVPVGSCRITCTYDRYVEAEAVTIEEGEGKPVAFDFLTSPFPAEWWMWTIVYTVGGGIGISQLLWLVKRVRESRKLKYE